MTWLFICLVARVVVVAIYLTLVVVDADAAAALHVWFGALVLAVAAYDLGAMVLRRGP
jgi:hypothetical protein